MKQVWKQRVGVWQDEMRSSVAGVCRPAHCMSSLPGTGGEGFAAIGRAAKARPAIATWLVCCSPSYPGGVVC